MTSIFKYTAFLSITVIVLSFASLAVFYKVKPPRIEKPASIDHIPLKVAVLNGCGREGLAASCARKLRDEGFDVVNGMGENADSFDFTVSAVVNRKGDAAKARYLAETLGIGEVLDQRSDNPYIIEDVIVVLGRDWDTLEIFSKEDNN